MSTDASRISYSGSYRNILIIKPGAVGDLLQMTPVVRALKQAFPLASLTLLVGNEASRELFRNNPNVAEVMVFDRKGAHRTLRSLLSLWGQIRSRRFDLVLNFQRSNLKTWMLATAAFPCRILVYHKARRRIVHAVHNYLETILPLGVSTSDDGLEYFPDSQARAEAGELLAMTGKPAASWIALNPGASHPVNRWPARRFAELADLLAERLPVGVIIIGGSGDIALAEEIIGHSGSKPASLAGKTSISQLAALLQRCQVLVSGDTGPMHLATAVGTPVVALFGAADPLRTGPIGTVHSVIHATGLPCVPCRSRTCTHPVPLKCMEAIEPSRVFEEIASLLQLRPVIP